MLNLLSKFGKFLLFFILMLFAASTGKKLHSNYLYNNVGDAVVKITYASGGGGTGFHIKAPSGKVYILTNKHICAGKNNKGEVLVQSQDSDRAIPRRVIEEYSEHDLCLVESLADPEYISLGNDPDTRDDVYVIGHPGLRALTLTSGFYISNETIKIAEYNVPKNKCAGEYKQIDNDFLKILLGIESVCIETFETNAISAEIHPGNSGSPVTTFSGKLIGVVFAGSSQAATDAHMVPLSFVEDFLANY